MASLSEEKAINLNPGDDIWVSGYCGPKCGTFQMVWPIRKRVLIEFHGEPEIVSLADCFMIASDCYFNAAAKEQSQASEHMRRSGEYFAKAVELQKENH